MAEMEEKLGAILNNPQMMQQIMSMAQSMSQSAPPPREQTGGCDSPPALDPGALQKLAGFASAGTTDSQQKALLNALSPYVSRNKLQRLEKAMQAAKIAQLASSFLGSGGLQTLIGR